MKPSVESPIYNYYFIGFIILALATIIVAYTIGSNQDMQYKNDYLLYRNYRAQVNQNNYQEAEKYIQPLVTRYKENYLIQWHYGVILMGKEKYQEAEEHMRLAREIRPALVTQPDYLFNYGEVLYKLNRSKDAERYLNECLKYKDTTYMPKAKELLKEISE